MPIMSPGGEMSGYRQQHCAVDYSKIFILREGEGGMIGLSSRKFRRGL